MVGGGGGGVPEQQGGDPCGRGAAALDDLSVAEAHREYAVDGGIEIALEIGVAGRGGVVKEATVELDDEPAVVDVAEDGGAGVAVTGLAPSGGRPCGRSTRSR